MERSHHPLGANIEEIIQKSRCFRVIFSLSSCLGPIFLSPVWRLLSQSRHGSEWRSRSSANFVNDAEDSSVVLINISSASHITNLVVLSMNLKISWKFAFTSVCRRSGGDRELYSWALFVY